MNSARKFRRLVVVAPMRSHCQTVRTIFENGTIPTYMRAKFNDTLDELAELDKTFGIVAGTGVGKTVFTRDICERQFGKDFKFDVVTKEEEATPYTWTCDVLIVTSGIAMHYLQAGYINEEDVIIIDEIHQTSEHLELTMAIAKFRGIPVNWMSATINPEVYRNYFGTDTLLVCDNRDPDKRATVESIKFNSNRSRFSEPNGVVAGKERVEYLLDDNGKSGLQKIIAEKRGVAVFLSTRAMCEEQARRYKETPGLHVDFYHGGENASKLRAYLKGEIPRPFIIFMTAAGASSLNVQGLDWVIIHDEMYTEVINEWTGVKALQRVMLGSNELLQMAGRVDGRVAGGLVTILTAREINYAELAPVNPRFVLSGDLEQVALTCARMEINLAELDTIGHIDRARYNETKKLLIDRGLIADNKLTDYGYEVNRYPVPRVWGEHLAQADDELLPFIIVCAACPSLYNMASRDGKYDIKEFTVAGNDFLTKYKIVQYVIDYFTYAWLDKDDNQEEFRLQREFFAWAKERGLYAKAIKETLVSVAAICRSLGISIKKVQNDFPDVTDEIDRQFKQMLIKVDALDFLNKNLVFRGSNYSMTGLSKVSVCQKDNAVAYYGQCSIFRNARGQEVRSLEGCALDFDDVKPHLSKEQRTIKHVAYDYDLDEIKVDYDLSGMGFGWPHYSALANVTIRLDKLPADDLTPEWQSKLENEFAYAISQAFIDSELPRDIFNHNLSVLNEIMPDELKLSWLSQVQIIKNCFKALFAGTGVYTLKMAESRQISLKLDLECCREIAYPTIKEHQAWQTVLLAAGNSRSQQTTSQPAVIRAECERYSPIGLKPDSSPLERRFRREFSKGAAPIKTPKPVVSKPAEPSIPQGKTQARVDWLTTEANNLRQQITAVEEELAKLRQAETAAAEKYGAAHEKRRGSMNELSAWQEATSKVLQKEKQLEQVKATIQPKIDELEEEALSVMIEIESK